MEEDPQGDRGWLRRYGEDVAYGLAVDVGKKAVGFVGVSVLGLLALLIWAGGSVPAWVLVPVVILSVLLPASLLRRIGSSELAGARNEVARVRGDLEEAEALAEVFAEALERHETYSNHVSEALDVLQRIVSHDIDVGIASFIETGVLEPARDVIEDKPVEHVRLSVLLPRDDEPDRWCMPFAAGHSLPGKAKYRVPISESLSRHAYETGDSQRWEDVAEDSGFRQNPEASYDTRSMISLPLRWGDRIVGVFNVISSEAYAFDPAEETYIEALGGVIAVAVGVQAAGGLDDQSSGSE